MKARNKTAETLETKKTSGKKPSKVFTALGITLTAAVLIVAGVIFYQKAHYKNRWYKNTSINGVDVSGQTLEKSKEKLLFFRGGRIPPPRFFFPREEKGLFLEREFAIIYVKFV